MPLRFSPFKLSKDTHIDYQTIRKILSGKGKIRVPIALKLGKYFGKSPKYFVNIQCSKASGFIFDFDYLQTITVYDDFRIISKKDLE